MSASPSPSPRSESPSPGGGERRHLFSFIGNRFFAGFAVAIPLIVTLWMLALSYRFILFVGRPVIDVVFRAINLGLDRTAAEGNLISPPEWFLNVFGILTPIIIFIALGIMATNVLGAKILALFDRLVLKFPVISIIYSGLKQVMDSFRNFGVGRNFKRVAYVEYPSPGCRLIGFVTGQYHDAQIGKDVTSIFIPTSPNPMTGFVIVAENERVLESALTIEQASKVILSAGLVAPDFNPPASSASDQDPVPPEENQDETGAQAGRPAIASQENEAHHTSQDQPTPALDHGSPSNKGPLSSPFGTGKDPVVRHQENTALPAASAFDGLTGYEDNDI